MMYRRSFHEEHENPRDGKKSSAGFDDSSFWGANDGGSVLHAALRAADVTAIALGAPGLEKKAAYTKLTMHRFLHQTGLYVHAYAGSAARIRGGQTQNTCAPQPTQRGVKCGLQNLKHIRGSRPGQTACNVCVLRSAERS